MYNREVLKFSGRGMIHKHIVGLLLSVMLAAVFVPGVSFAFERYNHVVKFDPYFSKYTKRYFGPAFNWKPFKAQAVAESRLDAEARSHVGAKGVMQIMPETFEEIMKKNPTIKGTLEQPRWNISAGIWYDKSIWDIFKADRPMQDRFDFMFGSFNAGKGNILKAQNVAKRKGLDPNLWESIEKTLPSVTGRHSRETLGYVKKIKIIQGALN